MIMIMIMYSHMAVNACIDSSQIIASLSYCVCCLTGSLGAMEAFAIMRKCSLPLSLSLIVRGSDFAAGIERFHNCGSGRRHSYTLDSHLAEIPALGFIVSLLQQMITNHR